MFSQTEWHAKAIFDDNKKLIAYEIIGRVT
jgi:hypothetical protein